MGERETLMAYQHTIVDGDAELHVRLIPEVLGRFTVDYRVGAPGRFHRDDWQRAEHCTPGEVPDVVWAISQGFIDDIEASGLF